MRKFVLAASLAATLMPAGAMAQSWGEARRADRAVQEDRRDLRDAYRYGDRRDVAEARADLRDSRRERREDWQDWRRSHPDVYRGPAYVGPVRNWRYRPVAVGYRFEPVYYGRRYWVDADRYRLPRPIAGQRWIRYGNDVVLVDGRGRVRDVHSGFFY